MPKRGLRFLQKSDKEGEKPKAQRMEQEAPTREQKAESEQQEAASFAPLISNHTFLASQPQPQGADLTSLLQNVVAADEFKVLKALKAGVHPKLYLVRGRVTDPAGRTFLSASAAQLWIWNGELPNMAETIVNILLESGEQMAKRLISEWAVHCRDYLAGDGLAFELPDGSKGQSLFFDPKGQVDALRSFMDSFRDWHGTMRVDREKGKPLWHAVGVQQFLLPDACMYRLLNNTYKEEFFKRTWRFLCFANSAANSVEWPELRKGVNLTIDGEEVRGVLGENFAISLQSNSPCYTTWDFIVHLDNKHPNSSSFIHFHRLAQEQFEFFNQLGNALRQEADAFTKKLFNISQPSLVKEQKTAKDAEPSVELRLGA